MTDRNDWIDNLKLFLTLTVITHHAAIAYGAKGLFGLNHPGGSPVTSILLTLMVAVNQSYFMGLFFFLSALFSPACIDRSGPGAFLKKRAFRLGIPLLISVIFIRPLIAYMIAFCRDGNPGGYTDFALNYLRNWDGELGPLWFLAALLLFHAAYALFYVYDRKRPARARSRELPGRITLALTIIILTGTTWLMRTRYPVGRSVVFGFQPGHFAQYILAYRLGVLASRNGWLEKSLGMSFRPWRRLSVILLILLPLAMTISALAGVTNESFMGGKNLFNLSYALFEALAFFGISLTLIDLFRRKLNRSSLRIKSINRETFFVYFIHELCLIILIGSYYDSALPPALLFLIVTLMGIVTSFSMSFCLRRMPLLRAVF